MTQAATPALYDMHCHLDFAGNALELARKASSCGLGALSCSVTPRGYLAAREAGLGAPATSGAPTIALAAGLHPWWLADGSCTPDDVELLEELVGQTRFVGEIGLDFAPRRAETCELQLGAFEHIVAACARSDAKTVSMHAVRSAGALLDVLDRHGLTSKSACILHWFSGSSEELSRAVRMGCYFSLGTRSLQTKRGRAYVRAIPRDRLLLETDWPDEPAERLDPASWVTAWHWELQQAAELMAGALGCETADLIAQLERNSRTALGI